MREASENCKVRHHLMKVALVLNTIKLKILVYTDTTLRFEPNNQPCRRGHFDLHSPRRGPDGAVDQTKGPRT